jgi:23S rRNA (cytosine1962-C5)-methyltransferase
MDYKGVKFLATPTPFRHLGFFPEQASHWDFIETKIKEWQVVGQQKTPVVRHPKFLNLFGYTGVASLFALRAGAEVTHVDASKQTLNWVKENQKVSGLEDLPLRIIEDDAIKFLEREEKRGNKYDAIIMDPPKFGRGPKGEVWKLEEMLPKLLSQARKVLSDKPLFVILTSYAVDSSSLSLGYALADTMKDFKGKIETGELCVLEKSNQRLISLANTAVWSKIE